MISDLSVISDTFGQFRPPSNSRRQFPNLDGCQVRLDSNVGDYLNEIKERISIFGFKDVQSHNFIFLHHISNVSTLQFMFMLPLT